MTEYRVELTPSEARMILAAWEGLLNPRNDSPGAALVNAIRANPPKPPRMDEPGWGEKVIASVYKDSRCEWVNAYHGRDVGNVWTNAQGFHASWDDLIDPEPWQADQ